MAELVAQGPKPEQHWRQLVPENQPFTLGKMCPPFDAKWDDFISRKHATLLYRDGQLQVDRIPTSRNPIYVKGEAATSFLLKPGDRFVIGETSFTLSDEAEVKVDEAEQNVQKRNFSAKELMSLQVRDASHQIDVLSKLPDVVGKAANDAELFIGLIGLLLAGIKQAEQAALVTVEGEADAAKAKLLSWDRRDRRAGASGRFKPSSRLILEAVRQQETVLHVWTDPGAGSGTINQHGNLSYTQDSSVDWAYCTPLRGDVNKGWAIYVAGRFGGFAANSVLGERGDPGALADDLKFTELVAALWGALRHVNFLKQRQASLSQFFSPTVLRNMTDDPEVVLKPRETQITVLFCDLRGFSRQAERCELLDMLARVSEALGVMTKHILEQGGVIGDFHGDAAMGFWGWPLAQPDAVERACLAALGIRADFADMANKPSDTNLANFSVGIGIGSGPAVAGKIGTVDQVKVTAFGPVVNLASRLEGMTKTLGVPILMDEETAKIVRQRLPADKARARRMAKVRPFGMEKSLLVSELLPPEPVHPLLTAVHLADYEAALDAFLASQWPRAVELLHKLPPADQGKDFLTEYIYSNRRTPPPDWDGVIEMRNK